MGTKEQGAREMKDVYLERKDQEIKKLKDDYWRVREGDGEAILFDMLVKIDDKTTYIAEYPERAKNHYSKNRDAAFVRSVRTSLGLTQEAFGHRLGVTATTVNRWENGKMPLSDNQRSRISIALGYSSNPAISFLRGL
jgi:DNA-binding transcriptional regulator YiaG